MAQRCMEQLSTEDSASLSGSLKNGESSLAAIFPKLDASETNCLISGKLSPAIFCFFGLVGRHNEGLT